MCGKPSILILYPTYLPGYLAGGPVRSISNLVERLGDKFNIKILTLNIDKGSSLPYQNIDPHIWNRVGKAHVKYLDFRKSRFFYFSVNAVIREVDIVYLNGFFDSVFTFKVLLLSRFGFLPGKKIILAPRGEFSENALALKALKKRCYIRFVKLFGLTKDINWHLSSQFELVDLSKSFNEIHRDRIFVAMNLTPNPAEILPSRKVNGFDISLKLCFLGRVSPMKNIDFAIEVLRLVKSIVIFTIYGPIEDLDYYADCCASIRTLGSNIECRFAGRLAPESIRSELSLHDLFFLPTRGENYGHVIYEALLAGLPVLISDRTPWTQVVENHVGWTFSLDSPEPFANLIDEFSQLSAEQIYAYSLRAYEFARQRSEVDDSVVLTENMFLNVVKSIK